MVKSLSFVQQNWLALAFVGLLIAAFFMLRNKPTDVASLEGLDAMVGGGQPAIIEFYSNT
jgi:hypothetical protein